VNRAFGASRTALLLEYVLMRRVRRPSRRALSLDVAYLHPRLRWKRIRKFSVQVLSSLLLETRESARSSIKSGRHVLSVGRNSVIVEPLQDKRSLNKSRLRIDRSDKRWSFDDGINRPVDPRRSRERRETSRFEPRATELICEINTESIK